MKKIIIFLLIYTLLTFPTFVFAQKNGNNGVGQQIRVQDPTSHTLDTTDTPQVQNQNQIQTQNESEDSQLEVSTKEQESLEANKPNLRSQVARENMSQVAQQVEELLTNPDQEGGIGEQVREIAQAQKQAQTQIGGELEKLEAKNSLAKKLFGPNYQAIRNLEKIMEQNRLRIEQLEQIANQVENQADQTQLQETIQSLVSQNTALENQVQAEENLGSLFGWLVKLFNR